MSDVHCCRMADFNFELLVCTENLRKTHSVEYTTFIHNNSYVSVVGENVRIWYRVAQQVRNVTELMWFTLHLRCVLLEFQEQNPSCKNSLKGISAV